MLCVKPDRLLVAGEGTDKGAEEFPYLIPYELGTADFAPGDSIEIREVRGNRDMITRGGTYCVEGTYALTSLDEAQLSFFATANSGPSRIDSKQTVRIKKGKGSFRLIKFMKEDGYLHLSFYPVTSGADIGGVYFGQGDWVLRQKTWKRSPVEKGSADSSGESPASSGINRAIMKYLADPVAVPAKMDDSYTKEGLIKGVHLAAQKANISIQRVEIEDSEYPFLVGLVCPESEWERLKAQLRKMDQYEYQGSVGGHDHYTINIVPRRAYPADASERISRRVLLREQIFHDKMASKL